MENLILLRTAEEVNALADRLLDEAIEYVALDTETTGVTKDCECVGYSVAWEQDTAYYVVLAEWKVKEIQEPCTECRGEGGTDDGVYAIECANCLGTGKGPYKKSGDQIRFPEVKAASERLMAVLTLKKLILHNSPFDCFVIQREFGIELMPFVHTDTMELSHLLNENEYCGLKDIALREFGESAVAEQAEMKASVIANGGIWQDGKGKKSTKEMYKADSNLLGKYGAKDTILTLKIFYLYVPRLFDEGLDSFFYEDESMPLMRGPTYHMNTTGMKIDMKKLKELEQTLTEEVARLKLEIQDDIQKHTLERYPNGFGNKGKGKFNVGSGQQLAWLLFIKLGNEFKILTDGGRDVSREAIGKVPYNAAAKRQFISALQERAADATRDIARLTDEITTLKAVIRKEKVDKAPLEAKHEKLKKQLKAARGRLTRSAAEKYIKCDKDTLTGLAKKYGWVAKLLHYRAAGKLLVTYVQGIQARANYGVIYPSFLQHGTTSGRYSCIAEGQTVSMPGGDKPIEQVRPGEFVYCYDESGRPTIRKVLKVFDNGVQDCIELKWRSQGSHKQGTLVCTPDHRLKTRERGWVRAEDLEYCDRIFHLRRAINPVNGRLRVYGADYFSKNEEQLIKEELLHGTSHDHVHHRDENKSNNTLENLELLSAEEHTRLHGREAARSGRIKWKHLHLPENRPTPVFGPDNPNWIAVSRFGLLRMLAKARGKATGVPMDFDTFKRKADLLGIDLKHIKRRYNSAGQYISRGFLLKIQRQTTTQRAAVLKSGVNFYDYKALCRQLGLEANHKILSTSAIGPRRVYDLEVEGLHNFIVNELCVHNCSNPNFQNLPRDDKRVKSCIVARPGKVFIGADYSQLEPRTFTSVSQDEALKACFARGEDFYSVVGIPVWKKFECSSYKKDANSLDKMFPQVRQNSKILSLATPYGRTANQQASQMRDEEGNNITVKEAQDLIDAYFDAYPAVQQMMIDSHEMAMRDGVVYNLFGRPRRIPEAMRIRRIYGKKATHDTLPYEARTLLNLGMNHRVQSTAASIVNRAAIAFLDMCAERALTDARWAEVRLVLQVHDELIAEAPEEIAEAVAEVMKIAMEQTVVLPGVDLVAEPKIGHCLADLK